MFCGETATASRSESSLEIMVKSLLRLADKSKGNSAHCKDTRVAENVKCGKSVRRSAFSVQRSAFSVQRSEFGGDAALSVRCSAFGVRRSAFGGDAALSVRR